MLHSILLATAGGPGGISAADWISAHLASDQTTVHIIVLETLSDEYEAVGMATSFPATSTDSEQRARRDVDEIVHHTLRHLIGFGDVKTSAIIGGQPVEELLAAVRHIQPDLLVWGRRGLTRWESVFLGNISSKTAAQSPVPFLVIPNPRRG